METQEKSMQNETMENSMCEESMEKTTDDSMTEMEAMPKGKMDVKPHCAISGLIKNHIIVLEDALNEAKMRYADAALDDENWSGKYERKMECKVLEGQIAILSKLDDDFECMLAPQTAMSA